MTKKQNITAIIVVIITIVVWVSLALFAYNHNSKMIARDTQTIKDEKYTCYYNGQEVSIYNIDLNQYDYKIDIDNKKVYMTDKRR